MLGACLPFSAACILSALMPCRSSPLITASAAASNVAGGELARAISRTCQANFGQFVNPCSRAIKTELRLASI